MADDSSKAPQQASQDIDLDNIEVEVLIICKNASQLNSTSSFLTRRGWPTTVISDLTKAIEHLADKKPDFVLVSFSHASSRITKLPDLITTTFNLTCIGFVENSDAQSNAKLSAQKLKYKINGQASGPSVHRTIRKILAERFNIKSDEKNASEKREAKEKEAGGAIKIKGGGTAANGPGVIMQKNAANATRDKGPQMVKGQSSKEMSETQDGNSHVSGAAYQPEEGDNTLPDDANELDDDSVGGGIGGKGATNRGPRKSLKALAESSTESTSKSSSGNNGKDLQEQKEKLKKALLDEASEGDSDSDGGEGESAERSSGAKKLKTLGSGFEGSDAEGSESLSATDEGIKGPGGKNSTGQSLLEVAKAATEKVEAEKAEKAAKRAAERAAEKAERESKKAIEEAAKTAAANAEAEKAAEARAAAEKGTPSYETGPVKAGNKVPVMEYDPSKENLAEAAAVAAEKKVKEEQEKVAKAKEEAEAIAKDPVRAAQSLMQKAVEAAMARYCKTPGDAEILTLEEITYIGVFPVESETVPGYLVVVWQAPDLSSREAFLRDCEKEIRAAFGSMSVNGKIGNGFWTQVPAVEFVAWADNNANFHFMTAHQKREVGVAFFKTASPLPKAQPAEGGMYRLKIQDLSTDVAVNFKAYIYLKHNKKHFLYLRNGRVLQPEQKKRLIENKVEDVFMKSVDLENLRQYLASGYLSGLIIEFNFSIASASQLTRKTS